MPRPFQLSTLVWGSLLLATAARGLYVSDIQREVADELPEVDAWVRADVTADQREFVDEVLEDPTLVVQSRGDYGVPEPLYLWSFDMVEFLAEFGNYMGDTYTVKRDGPRFHGKDGKGLDVNFFEAHRSSNAVIYTGKGTVRVMGLPTSGSFVNAVRFADRGDGVLEAESFIYVRVNNGLKRFLAKVVFAISDLEEAIKEKLFELDGTVIKVLRQLLDDPDLVPMLRADPTPGEADARITAEAKRSQLPGSRRTNRDRLEEQRRRQEEEDEGPETGRAEATLPALEGPLVLTTLEAAAVLREKLEPHELNDLLEILETWPGIEPELAGLSSGPADLASD